MAVALCFPALPLCLHSKGHLWGSHITTPWMWDICKNGFALSCTSACSHLAWPPTWELRWHWNRILLCTIKAASPHVFLWTIEILIFKSFTKISWLLRSQDLFRSISLLELDKIQHPPLWDKSLSFSTRLTSALVPCKWIWLLSGSAYTAQERLMGKARTFGGYCFLLYWAPVPSESQRVTDYLKYVYNSASFVQLKC